MTDRNVKIEIYSDVICPWCYVGKRRLERALCQVGNVVKVDVTWRSFQLNPTMSTQGMDRTVYLETKFGSLAVFREMEERLLEAGRVEHIPFAFEKLSRTPNTFQVHRVIWYAGVQGCQDAVVDQLFKGYFEEGLDIGSSSVLIELADRAGLNAAPFLESGEGIAEVRAEESTGRRLGIRAVPYFVFDRTHGVSGAQPVEVFAAAIQTVQAQDTRQRIVDD